tara:strand:+ start:270 stop:788 length:519 start_codon:yes stop_codon:yes gene_type:complete
MNNYKNENIIDMEYLCILCLENKKINEVIKHDECREGIICKECLIKMQPRDINKCFVCRQQTNIFKNYIIENRIINQSFPLDITNNNVYCCSNLSNREIIRIFDKILSNIFICLCVNVFLLLVLFISIVYSNTNLENKGYHYLEIGWIIFNCVLVLVFMFVYVLKFFINRIN